MLNASVLNAPFSNSSILDPSILQVLQILQLPNSSILECPIFDAPFPTLENRSQFLTLDSDPCLCSHSHSHFSIEILNRSLNRNSHSQFSIAVLDHDPHSRHHPSLPRLILTSSPETHRRTKLLGREKEVKCTVFVNITVVEDGEGGLPSNAVVTIKTV